MNKKVLASILLLSPCLAWASGSEVLSLLWLGALVFAVVLISLYLAKFQAKQKLIVFGVYLVAALVAFLSTSGIPYLKNMYLINTINTVLPLTAWLVIYVYYSKKQKT
jgi:hypothetical protein